MKKTIALLLSLIGCSPDESFYVVAVEGKRPSLVKFSNGEEWLTDFGHLWYTDADRGVINYDLSNRLSEPYLAWKVRQRALSQGLIEEDANQQ